MSDNGGGKPTPPTGADRLRAVLRRLARRQRKRAPRSPFPSTLALRDGDEWPRSIETRLTELESKLSSQNRLLILTIISVAADLLYSLTGQGAK